MNSRPPPRLRLFEQDVWLAAELTRQDRTRDGYLLLDAGLAGVEGFASVEWREALGNRYRSAMVQVRTTSGRNSHTTPDSPALGPRRPTGP